MRFVFAALFAWVSCSVFVATGFAKEGKHALIIGNAAYEHASVLRNPARDSRAIRTALKKLGFEVEYGQDLTWAQTQEIVAKFLKKAGSAKTALFFYAGHGIQIRGQNFIIPVDANFSSADDLDSQIVSMNDIFRHIDKRSDTGLVFLDACRDNPFRAQIQKRLTSGEVQLTRSMGQIRLKRGLARVESGAEESGGPAPTPTTPDDLTGRPLPSTALSVGLGLAEIDGGEGMFVAYATRPGQVALDGKGKHSPFTEGLLKYLNKPGLEIRQVLTRVRRHVRTKTEGKQTPWDSSSLIDDFYLAALTPDAAVAAKPPVTGKRQRLKPNRKKKKTTTRKRKRTAKARPSKSRSSRNKSARTPKKSSGKKRRRMFLP